ncbi:MAG: radical SAM family heme chaperone HemW [Treponema sp.]|jgi:oxygen-independent coproporphyrinogen-3 oxidase|nr:radical SAM family heme chaperone HemW [Treponema sp.]
MEREASVYIHVPFCASLCDYCDFYSISLSPEDPRLDRYVDLALEDLAESLSGNGIDRVPAVYIGGGTPSALGAERLDRLLRGIGALLPCRDASETRGAAGGTKREFTLEANPESADQALLRLSRERGVTRLSLGVQSFHGPSRRAVHRAGDPALLPDRLAAAAACFGEDLSLDLMSGLPHQDEQVLLRDIETALSHKPGHLSLYALTLAEGTPLAEAASGSRAALPEGDEADRLWIIGRDALEAAGYAQYEVSNFSLPGKQSGHNTRYWRMENWLGLGPGGSGTLIDDETGTGLRRTFKPDLDLWLNRGASPNTRYTEEPLDRRALMEESILMGFRCLEGPDPALFERRFRRPLQTLIPRTIERWESRGLLQNSPLALTREGLLFLNAFLEEAFSELSRGHEPRQYFTPG